MEKEFVIVDPYENELHTYMWTPKDQEIIGVVQIVHGAGEHAGRYREFAHYLNGLGFIVIGNDLLGHGKTAKGADHIFFANSLGFHKVYEGVRSVRDYIEEHYPELPVAMFAHSMGSFIGRYAILYDYKRYDAALFSGTGYFKPLNLLITKLIITIIEKIKGPHYVSDFVNYFVVDKAVRSMKKNGLINKRIEWISHDRTIQEQVLEDPLCNLEFSVSARKDIVAFLPEIQSKKRIKASASSTAIFFLSGELDALGGYGNSVKKLFQVYRDCGYSNVKFTLINNARHEVINEIDRDATHHLIGEWLTRNMT